MVFHLGAGALIEGTLEEVGEELDQLTAGEILRSGGAHGVSSAAHPASACRTRVRARWSNTL